MSTALALHFGLIVALALLAFGLGRAGRRNELVHLAWVLVFVKLLVPPFVRVPVLAPETAPEPLAQVATLPSEAVVLTPVAAVPIDLELLPGPVPAPPAPPALDLDPRAALLTLWIAGMVLSAGLLARSIRRYRSLLGPALPPPDVLVREADAAARALGLARPPRLHVTAARVSPALWPSLRSTLVVPLGLIESLSPAELRHVLLHEMAHHARRDHWVRLLEAVAQVAYWWFPLLPWMRRRLRSVEEDCCDARVLRSGGDRSTYANALIRSVEFLQDDSERPPALPALPALATGAFGGDSMTRRITTIMSAHTPRPDRSALRALFALCLLALIPLMPARASATPPTSSVYSPPALPAVAVGAIGDEPAVDEQEQRLLAAAMEVLDLGDAAGALELLGAGRGREASAALDFAWADLALELDRPDEASDAYRVAVAKHPSFTRAWRNLGQVQLRLGDLRAASEALSRTIALGGGDAQVHGMLGLCLLEADDHVRAERAFWTATVLDAEERAWRLGLLRALLEQDRFGDVQSLTTGMLAEDPDDAAIRRLRVNARLALGLIELALEDLARIDDDSARRLDRELGLDPFDDRAQSRSGKDPTESVRLDRALLLLDRAARTDPTQADGLLHRARTLLSAGDYVAARDVLWRAERLRPSAEIAELSQTLDRILQDRAPATELPPRLDRDLAPIDLDAPTGPTGTIRGSVVDADFGLSLAESEVHVLGTDLRTRADGNGQFVLKSVPVGRHTLAFTRQNFARQLRSDVVVEEGSPTEVSARLRAEFAEMEEYVVNAHVFEPVVTTFRMDGRVLHDGEEIDAEEAWHRIRRLQTDPGHEVRFELDTESDPSALEDLLVRMLHTPHVARQEPGEPIQIAVTIDGRIVVNGRDIELSGVRSLVRRLCEDGRRRLHIAVDAGADAALWRAVEMGAVLGGAGPVTRSLAPGGPVELSRLEGDPILIAITADGRVVYGGHEIGVAGVRPLVERLCVEGNRPVQIQVDAGSSPAVRAAVENAARLAGTDQVASSLVRSGFESMPTPVTERILIAVTEDGRVLYGGREIGVSGVQPLVERLLVAGERAVLVQVDGGAEVRVWTEVEQQALAAGASDVTTQLVLGVPVEELDSEPRVIQRPMPALPAELRDRAPAEVTLLLLLDETGQVSESRVLASTDTAFDRLALEAVKTWRFEPARRDGEVVQARLRTKIHFPAQD